MNIWKNYAGNLDFLKRRTIVLMKHGSHAYGTNGPTSDVDVRGVVIPPPHILFGFCNSFEQADKGFFDEEGKPLDCTIFSLPKLMKLAADNNPNCIEIPFIDPNDWIEIKGTAWGKIVGNRDLFLSRNCKHRFSGYAMSQLKRIRSHREWLFNPPKAPPTRTEFGLPEFSPIAADQRAAAEDQIKKQIEAWTVDLADVDDGIRISLLAKYNEAMTEIAAYSNQTAWEAAGRKLGFDENFLEHLAKERAYRAAAARWKQYGEWQRTRNEVRSELERKYGYDTKHGMHLVRLMRMAKEILTGKGVIVKRPDAEELVAIRNGAWSFDKLIEWAEPLDEELTQLMFISPLPKNPDRAALDALCQEIIEESL